MSIDDVLPRLSGVRRVGTSAYVALCPCHTEKTPSLSVRLAPGDGGLQCRCFGCGAGTARVLGAIGLSQGPPETRPLQQPFHSLSLAVLRRHSRWWGPDDARLLLNVEILIDMLRRTAAILHDSSTQLPPDLDVTWDMAARAVELEHDARLLEAAL